MVLAAKDSFRRRGVTATGFTQVLESAGAARGAIYHHFPGGKAEMTRAVMHSTGDDVRAAIEVMFENSTSPVDAVLAMIDLCIDASDANDGNFGCPVTPAVLEADNDLDTLAVGSKVFSSWQEALAKGLAPSVGDVEEARALATVIVSSIEGALVLSRAERSARPLRRTRVALEQLLTSSTSAT